MPNYSPESYRTLHAWLSETRRPVIVVHQHPDGDAFGSACGLAHFMRAAFGTEAAILAPDSWPDSLGFVTDGCTVINAEADSAKAGALVAAADLVVSLDHNAFSRTGMLEDALRNASCRKIMVDHHQNPDTGSYGLVFSEEDISSTCELLYHVLLHLPGVESAASLPERCAYCLMTGMTTDTNNFANSVYPSTLAMASDMLSAGVDRDDILDRLYRSCRPNRLAAMACFLGEKMKIFDGQLAYAVLDTATIERLGIKDGETEGFVNMPLSMKEVRYSVFLRQDGGVFRVSIRSKKGYSAAILAREYFNGGGHENAAGGRLPLSDGIRSAQDAENYILQSAARFLRSQGGSREQLQ